MLRVVVSDPSLSSTDDKPVFDVSAASYHLLLKTLSAAFQADCRKVGMVADVHAETIIEVLCMDYGYSVKIAKS